MAANLFNRDSMISVRETPWHGLGVVLEKPPESGLEAIQAAGLDWDVEKEPIFDPYEERILVNTGTKKNEGAWGVNVRKDIPRGNPDRYLGVVGPNYVPYQNRQMASLFDPVVKDGTITIETCGSLYNGKRVWMLGKFGQSTEIEKGDSVEKYMLFSHGHDGTFAARLGFTPIRVVCWNTLSAAVYGEESKMVRMLHTANMGKNLVTLRDAMKVADESFEMTAETFRNLTRKGFSRIDLKEYARTIVKADADEQKWTFQQKEKVVAIMANATEGRGNKGRTWWDAYNGVTEYVCWQACRSAERRLAEQWFGGGVNMSAEALKLAVEMSA